MLYLPTVTTTAGPAGAEVGTLLPPPPADDTSLPEGERAKRLQQYQREVAQVAKDKDLVQRLESTVIRWTRQIKDVVSSNQVRLRARQSRSRARSGPGGDSVARTPAPGSSFLICAPPSMRAVNDRRAPAERTRAGPWRRSISGARAPRI